MSPDEQRRFIKQYLASNGISLHAFAKDAGASDSALRAFLDMKTQSLHAHTWTKIEEKYLSASAIKEHTTPSATFSHAPRAVKKAEVYDIPLYDIQASCGAGTVINREKVLRHVTTPREVLATLAYTNPGNLVFILASGNSMEPTIAHGDTVLLDLGDVKAQPGIYALQYDSTLMIKRLMPQLNGKTCKVISDNTAYGEGDIVPMEDVRIIGKVIWLGKKV